MMWLFPLLTALTLSHEKILYGTTHYKRRCKHNTNCKMTLQKQKYCFDYFCETNKNTLEVIKNVYDVFEDDVFNGLSQLPTLDLSALDLSALDLSALDLSALDLSALDLTTLLH